MYYLYDGRRIDSIGSDAIPWHVVCVRKKKKKKVTLTLPHYKLVSDIYFVLLDSIHSHEEMKCEMKNGSSHTMAWIKSTPI